LLRSRPPLSLSLSLSLSPWIHVVQLKSSSLIFFPFIFKNQLPPPIGIHVHSTWSLHVNFVWSQLGQLEPSSIRNWGRKK
jgi:hypothetical protein